MAADRRAAALAAGVALAGLLGACRPAAAPPPDPLHVIGQADALVAAGDGSGALALLDSIDLQPYPAARLLRAEALMTVGRFDDAIAELADDGDDVPTVAIRSDACVLGVMQAARDNNAADADRRLAPCATNLRIDVVAAGFAAAHLNSRPVDEVAMGDLLERFVDHPPGPELDRAAELLESTALALADTVDDPYLRVRYLSRAWQVSREDALATRLVETALREGDALRDSNPQLAVSIYEHLYIARVPGLPVPEEAKRHAEQQTTVALLPVFCENFRSRYTHKFAEDDLASGLLSADQQTVTFAGADAEARLEAARAFLYRAYERPRPTPSPDFLALWGQCPPAPEPCPVPLDEIARWAYEIDRFEEEHAAAVGQPMVWPGATAP